MKLRVQRGNLKTFHTENASNNWNGNLFSHQTTPPPHNRTRSPKQIEDFSSPLVNHSKWRWFQAFHFVWQISLVCGGRSLLFGESFDVDFIVIVEDLWLIEVSLCNFWVTTWKTQNNRVAKKSNDDCLGRLKRETTMMRTCKSIGNLPTTSDLNELEEIPKRHFKAHGQQKLNYKEPEPNRGALGIMGGMKCVQTRKDLPVHQSQHGQTVLKQHLNSSRWIFARKLLNFAYYRHRKVFN